MNFTMSDQVRVSTVEEAEKFFSENPEGTALAVKQEGENKEELEVASVDEAKEFFGVEEEEAA